MRESKKAAFCASCVIGLVLTVITYAYLTIIESLGKI